ncbi:hypothetical protein F4561_003559 [Lipingzhangella halophila]|uniref:Cytochrome P450 n=1 Tax=Lipingzhangella halophila TaxID=1783352 RepID=A0A7W7RIR7_9ACTN|nr:cytochrome P450 [Lipingzhangella halophila]MBB4932739.1 hypothetical protein [Lipingzhangella halophila]
MALDQELSPAHSTRSADWVRLDDLHDDPYPVYARLRDEAPVAWVPAANRYLVTRYANVHHVDNDPETFSADETGSLMKRVMGHSLLRKDGASHARERKAAGVPLRPKAVKETWTPLFRRNAERLLVEMRDAGEAELVSQFAAPYAAANLRDIIGLPEVSPEDLTAWSQAMMDGTGNYADDPTVWARSEAATQAVDDALAEALPRLRANPDDSMISAMLHAEDPLSPAEISANVKVTIGGGLNEPRDVLGVAVWALLTHPEQRTRVLTDPRLFSVVFDEAVRWTSPIGMYPRQTTREVELGGAMLPAGARLGVVVGSANRDPRQFEDPDAFDIDRPRKAHLGFGSGAHYCLGAWVAKASVGQVALPMLFDQLPGLRLSGRRPVRAGGWVFRGLLDLPVAWDH